jgi:putative PIN family toxin of toxin-antitoxin system
VTEDERREFITALVRQATLIETRETVDVCRDPKDNKFLDLALCGKASCIISGDKDFLVLHPFQGIPILTPRQFLKFTWENVD